MLNSLCVFKCKCVDSSIGVRNDDFEFTWVDLKKLAYKNEPFIMVEQAKQVFYVQDPCDERWSVVLHGKTIGVNLEDDDSTLNASHIPLSTHMPTINGEDEVDDIHGNRNGHDERELISII